MEVEVSKCDTRYVSTFISFDEKRKISRSFYHHQTKRNVDAAGETLTLTILLSIAQFSFFVFRFNGDHDDDDGDDGDDDDYKNGGDNDDHDGDGDDDDDANILVKVFLVFVTNGDITLFIEICH